MFFYPEILNWWTVPECIDALYVCSVTDLVLNESYNGTGRHADNGITDFVTQGVIRLDVELFFPSIN